MNDVLHIRQPRSVEGLALAALDRGEAAAFVSALEKDPVRVIGSLSRRALAGALDIVTDTAGTFDNERLNLQYIQTAQVGDGVVQPTPAGSFQLPPDMLKTLTDVHLVRGMSVLEKTVLPPRKGEFSVLRGNLLHGVYFVEGLLRAKDASALSDHVVEEAMRTGAVPVREKKGRFGREATWEIDVYEARKRQINVDEVLNNLRARAEAPWMALQVISSLPGMSDLLYLYLAAAGETVFELDQLIELQSQISHGSRNFNDMRQDMASMKEAAQAKLHEEQQARVNFREALNNLHELSEGDGGNMFETLRPSASMDNVLGELGKLHDARLETTVNMQDRVQSIVAWATNYLSIPARLRAGEGLDRIFMRRAAGLPAYLNLTYSIASAIPTVMCDMQTGLADLRMGLMIRGDHQFSLARLVAEKQYPPELVDDTRRLTNSLEAYRPRLGSQGTPEE